MKFSSLFPPILHLSVGRVSLIRSKHTFVSPSCTPLVTPYEPSFMDLEGLGTFKLDLYLCDLTP